VKRLLLVGGFGFIGGNIAQKARGSMDVVIGGRRRHRGLESFSYCPVDITDRECVLAALEEVEPEAVVNAAAVSDIDFAEKNRELAWRVNVLGARYLAEGCGRIGAKYLFFSSDAVFDGTKEIYREEDAPNPLNFYGKTKAEAEHSVLSLWDQTVVVRISLVLGYPLACVNGGNAFYLSLEKRLYNGEQAAFPGDEYRTPVDVLTLAESVLELSEKDIRGIIHIGSTGSINRFELARKIAQAMGYDPLLIKSKARETIAGRAPRHRNGIISVEKAKDVLKSKMLGIEASIRRSIDERQ
jgi:dTDP-4-dehydrorhamnose reductase